jgi:hypothetical protein
MSQLKQMFEQMMQMIQQAVGGGEQKDPNATPEQTPPVATV